MAITQKHLYGWKLEKILKSYLENYLGESLVPTQYRYDGCDLVSEKSDNEIKARPKYSVKYKKLQTKETYDEWIVPTCKADKYKEGRNLNIFYYWGANQELFHIPYSPEKFKNYRREVPWYSTQEHFFIPKDDWILVKGQISDEVVV